MPYWLLVLSICCFELHVRIFHSCRDVTMYSIFWYESENVLFIMWTPTNTQDLLRSFTKEMWLSLPTLCKGTFTIYVKHLKFDLEWNPDFPHAKWVPWSVCVLWKCYFLQPSKDELRTEKVCDFSDSSKRK